LTKNKPARTFFGFFNAKLDNIPLFIDNFALQAFTIRFFIKALFVG
tara:strand:- start:535 stop:672 length:138 start_codon:yes stop_codon:yes gene_type:complete